MWRRVAWLPIVLVACGDASAPAGAGGGATSTVAGTATATSTSTATATSSGSGGDGGAATGTGGGASSPLALTSVAPAIVDPIGGSTIVARGVGFAPAGGPPIDRVEVGGVEAAFTVLSDVAVRIVTPALEVGAGLDVEVSRGLDVRVLPGALEAWSPAEIPGARLFDAASGVTVGGPATQYEWQRLTPSLGDDWRVRDGDTLTWLPSTGRYWMVGGWNGLQAPDGFSTLPEGSYPPENTTTEVWSSADGVAWRLEVPHGSDAFERRHGHNTVAWDGALWMIGGDTHQGFYNHDVISSVDGVHWVERRGPHTTPPPWSERALQMTGVHAGKLWMAGGQTLLGDPEQYVYHNDVWSSDDGVEWALVAPDAPPSETRWAGCGLVDGLVSFRGRLWLVGCARYRDDAVGTSMSNEVWSTEDGVTWTRHADPPWVGKAWPNVVVWDDRLWILFGYTYGDPEHGWAGGNANEAWYSDDGETWSSLPTDMPVPGSHAQGVAVRDDQLLLAGGNYGFDGFDKSVWRLVPKRGEAVLRWRARGEALEVEAPTAASRPVLVGEAFGEGRPGVELDGSRTFLALADDAVDELAGGLSVFWVARAPHNPPAAGWEQTFNPASVLVGGPVDGGYPRLSAGYTDGRLVAIARATGYDELGVPRFATSSAGDGLQAGVGAPRLAGVTLDVDGTTQLWIDGATAGEATLAPFDTAPAWSRIGAGMDGGSEGPGNRFGGGLGAVIVVPSAVDPTVVEKLHAWSRGRFGAP